MNNDNEEDQVEVMQRKLDRLESRHMHLDPTPDQIARAKRDALESIKRREQLEALMKRDPRIGLPDVRQDKTERRHGDRRGRKR